MRISRIDTKGVAKKMNKKKLGSIFVRSKDGNQGLGLGCKAMHDRKRHLLETGLKTGKLEKKSC